MGKRLMVWVIVSGLKGCERVDVLPERVHVTHDAKRQSPKGPFELEWPFDGSLFSTLAQTCIVQFLQLIDQHSFETSLIR